MSTITVINPGYGFSWVGCYVDKQNPRALAYPGISTTSSSMTVEYCASFCQGYNYMGVEYADECYCANTVSSNSFLATTETGYTCESNTYACTGNSSEFCGGYGTLDLYAQPDQTTTAAYPDDTGGSYVYVTDSHIVSSQNSTNGSVYDYIGCWVDPGASARALNGPVNTSSNDVGTCADYCQGYTYFGLENGGNCYCGNSIDNGASLAYCQNECYACCSVDLTQRCGGYYRLTMYELNGPSNFTDPHPDATCTYNGPATAAATVVSSSISKRYSLAVRQWLILIFYPPLLASTYTYYGPVTTGSIVLVVVTTNGAGATTSYTTTSYACDDNGNCATNPHTPGGATSLSMNMATETDTTTVLSTSTTTLSLTTTLSSGETDTTTAWSASTTTLSLTTTISSSSALTQASAPATCVGMTNGSVSTDSLGCEYNIYCGYELNSEASTVEEFDSGDFTQCETLCDGDANCAGFTWIPGSTNGGTCYSKPAGGSLISTGSSYIGGVLIAGTCQSASLSSASSTSIATSAAASTNNTLALPSSSATELDSSSSSVVSSSAASATATSCAATNNTQLTTLNCNTYELSCGFSVQGTLISTTDAATTDADCATYCDDSNGCIAWVLDDTGICSAYSSAAFSLSTSSDSINGILNQTASGSACASSTAVSSTASTTTAAAATSAAGCSALNGTQLTSSGCNTYDLYCSYAVQGQAVASSKEYSDNACASSCDSSNTCSAWSWDSDTSLCNTYDIADVAASTDSDDANLVVGTLDTSADDPTCLTSTSNSPSSSLPSSGCSTVNDTQISTSDCRAYDLYCAYTIQDQYISTTNETTNYACAAFCDGISGCAAWTWSANTSVCNAYSSTQLSPLSDQDDQDFIAGVIDSAAAAASCPSVPTNAATSSSAATPTNPACADVSSPQVAIGGSNGCDVYELYCGYTVQGSPFASSFTADTTDSCATFCNEIGNCQAWTLDPTTSICSAYSTTSISSSPDSNSIAGVLNATASSSVCSPTTTSTTTTSPTPTTYAPTLPANISASTTFTRPASLSTPITTTTTTSSSPSSSPSSTLSSTCAALNGSTIHPASSTSSSNNENATYTLLCDTYINTGSTLALTTVNTASDCAAFCAGTPGCAAWTLDPSGDCYAYTSEEVEGSGVASYPGWVSGVLSQREPDSSTQSSSSSSTTALGAGTAAAATSSSALFGGGGGGAGTTVSAGNATIAVAATTTTAGSVYDAGATTVPHINGYNATTPAIPGMSTSPAAPFGLAPYSGACYCTDFCTVRTTVVPVWE